MPRSIILEHPDGSIAIRGGLGVRQLAKWLLPEALRHRTLSQKGALAIIAAASPGEIDAARDSALDHILRNLVPIQNPGTIAHVEDIVFPEDRVFRQAWRRGIGTIDTDMPKARDIWRDKMRAARQPKLAALDVDFQRADERGDQAAKAAIAAEKQKLRDVTARPEIEAAQTPEQLKAFWPADLA